MSAFCGTFCLDGGMVDRLEFASMHGAIQRSGQDRSGEWFGGSVALGHHMLQTTPESLTELLPFEDFRAGLVITADARIDNREELFAALEIPKAQQARISDSQLILEAYAAWGDRCAERLLGDFAFAIWDSKRGELYCARDHIGVRPFYYTRALGPFHFASDLKALLALPGIRREVNESRLRNSFDLIGTGSEATFYKEIYRLPAATWLRVGLGKSVKQSYWSLDSRKELPPASTEDYETQFSALFTEAVRCRLRSAFPVASHLSGGLDSSAVTCVARELLRTSGTQPLKTYSNVFPRVPVCDEREYIQAVLDGGDLEPTFVEADSVGPWAGIDRHFQREEECVYPPNTVLFDQLGAAMHRSGIRVCLDGYDGDTVVSHAEDLFSELAIAGKWDEFARTAAEMKEVFPELSEALIFSRFGLPHLKSLAHAGRWLHFVAMANRARCHFVFSPFRIWLDHGLKAAAPFSIRRTVKKLLRLSRKSPDQAETAPATFFSKEFLRRFGPIFPPETDPRKPSSVREDQCTNLTSGTFSFALEFAGRIYSDYGIDARHPFLDKRLIEFCVALPSKEKRRGGFGRAIMRQALRSVLPVKIRMRPGKTDISQSYIYGALRFDSDRIKKAIAEEASQEDRFLDIQEIEKAFDAMQLRARVTATEFTIFWVALSTSAWLRNKKIQISTINLQLHPKRGENNNENKETLYVS